jgi:hypothetical protein
VLLVVFVIAFVISAILDAIGAAIGSGGLIIASIIAGSITAPLPAVAISVMYFDLGGGRGARAGPSATAAAPPPAI